jgi:hypothetical protein
VSSDGEQVGTVRRVLDNAREHIFDGIVMDAADGRRFVDALRWRDPRACRLPHHHRRRGRALPEQGSAMAIACAYASTVRRARRVGRSWKERWDRR